MYFGTPNREYVLSFLFYILLHKIFDHTHVTHVHTKTHTYANADTKAHRNYSIHVHTLLKIRSLEEFKVTQIIRLSS